jgi:hypothetical protein
MPLLVRDGAGGSDDAVRDLGERAAGGGVEEPVIPRVADATAEGRKPLFLDLVAEGGVGRKFDALAFLFAAEMSPSKPSSQLPFWRLKPEVRPMMPPLKLRRGAWSAPVVALRSNALPHAPPPAMPT